MIQLEAGDDERDPVAASAAFHRNTLPLAEEALQKGDLAILFPPADHTHREWRLAVTAMLARKYTPHRCNGVAAQGPAREAILDYLANAPAVTGQYVEGAGQEGAGGPD